MEDSKVLLCKLHPDFHLPANVKVGDKFDGEAYAMRAKKAGVDNLVCYAKDHYGHAYYPTLVGTMHPGLGFDMLGEFVKGCRSAGISPSVDYSVFLDTAAIISNPDWVLRESPEESDEVFSQKYLPVCVNSGYLEEMLIPQTLELLENYDVDELFFDTMSDFKPCYCKSCRENFGRPIPLGNDSPDWSDYVLWYIRRYDLFFDRILQAVHDTKPHVSVVVNWRWSATLPVVPAKHVKRLVGDLFTSPALASYFSRYWAGTGYPFDYMCGRFMHGLGDWSSNTSETLKAVAAATVANGGSFYIIDRQLPDGTLEERSYPLVEDIFSFVQKRREVLVNTKHVQETAVLHSLENIIGSHKEFFPDTTERERRLKPLKAVSQIFIRSGRHYTALNTERLLETLENYSLLILPEVDFIDESAVQKIKAFVEKGGRVLIIQSDSQAEVNESLLSLARVENCGRFKSKYAYISSTKNGVSNPILVRGRFLQVKAKENTESYASLLEPWCEEGPSEFGHGFAPAADETGYSSITRRALGSGEIIYIAAPVLTSYFTYLNPDIKELISALYDILLPNPIAKIDNPAHIELSVMRKTDDLIIHLVNQSGKETSIYNYLFITEYIPVLNNIKLKIRKVPQAKEIIFEPDGVLLEYESKEEYIEVTIPDLHIMSTCRVKGYFSAE